MELAQSEDFLASSGGGWGSGGGEARGDKIPNIQPVKIPVKNDVGPLTISLQTEFNQ